MLSRYRADKADRDNPRKSSTYMVFEYLEHDLAGLMGPSSDGIKKATWFSLPQIKCYAQQLFRALHFVHKNKVIHRDVKGARRAWRPAAAGARRSVAEVVAPCRT